MDGAFVSLSEVKRALESLGFGGWSFEKAPYGRNSLTLLLRQAAGRDVEYVIQIPKSAAIYQAAKKAAIYNLVGEHTSIPVPRTSLCWFHDRPCLVMSFCHGTSLSDLQGMDKKTRQSLLQAVGSTVAKLHTRIPAGEVFGWLDGQGISKPFKTFGDYMRSETTRIQAVLSKHLDAEDLKWLDTNIWPRLSMLFKFEAHPTFVWYDIHSDNILVGKGSGGLEITGWLDPGAARIGAPEWDIAHACEHLCKSATEEKWILQNYLKNTGRNIDHISFDGFRTLIILDDMALAITTQWGRLRERCWLRLKQLNSGLF